MDPGWYEDPLEFGWLRYWDGATWTRDTAPRPADYRPPEPHTPRAALASFGRRLLAYIVDSLIVTIPVEIAVLAGWAVLNADALTQLSDLLARGDARAANELLLGEAGILIAMSLLTGPAWFAYEYLTLRRWSATAGMMLLRIRVAQEGDNLGQAPTRRAVAIRAAVFGTAHLLQGIPVLGIMATIAFLIDCLSMLNHPSRQTWHDRWARTVVVVEATT